MIARIQAASVSIYQLSGAALFVALIGVAMCVGCSSQSDNAAPRLSSGGEAQQSSTQPSETQPFETQTFETQPFETQAVETQPSVTRQQFLQAVPPTAPTTPTALARPKLEYSASAMNSEATGAQAYPPANNASVFDPAAGGSATRSTADRRDVSQQYEIGNPAQIFFATDRLPTAELLPSGFRNFAPVGVVTMIACALFIGFCMTRRLKTLWMLAFGASLCVSLFMLHSSVVRWQQAWRLASNASTSFSALRYTSDDYPMVVGMAEVSLPKRHRAGHFEKPSLLKLEFVESPEKHIVLHSVAIDSKVDDWFARLSKEIKLADEHEGFVFIHGYNVKFADALKRTAQLATDLDIDGPAVCFSWPSQGRLEGYAADEATVSWSAPHFEQLLIDLREKSGCKKINIIAHSMGNRALLEALERLNLRLGNQASGKLINSLVMAAPDVDMATFQSRFAIPIKAQTQKTTLYYSSVDRALQVSARVHGSGRLGFIADELPNLPGIDVISIGDQPLFGLGHSYYGSDPVVMEDIKIVLRQDIPLAQRPFLRMETSASGRIYWQLDRLRYASLKEPSYR